MKAGDFITKYYLKYIQNTWSISWCHDNIEEIEMGILNKK